MSDLFFNPNGRLASADFIYAGYILILIGTAFQILAMINFELAQKLNLLSYILIYPWLVIWIKRLHNGGQSGFMVLSYLALYFVLSSIGFLAVEFMFAEEKVFQIALEASQDKLSDAELEARLTEWVKQTLLPSTISSTLVSLATLHIGDKTIPVDPKDNKYGPAKDF